MEYTTLGNTDIQISKLCVGCMSFGKAGTMHDWTLNETETEKVVKHLYPIRGIRFCPFLFSRRGIPTVILQFGYSRTQKIREISKGGQRPPFGSGSSKRGESIPVGIGYPKGNSVALGRGIQRGQRPPWYTILLCKV